MSNKAPLLRMLFLIMFLIIILVIFSTLKTKNIVNNPSDSFFKENIIWQHKNKAYTLLLHSVAINDCTISAYSVKLDTIMTFAILEPDLNSIYNKLGNIPYTQEQCIKCHSAK